MFDDPLSLQGVYSSNFHSKMQKITVLACQLAKNSTASQKNCTDVSAPSACFYNLAHDYWSTDDINDENWNFSHRFICFEKVSLSISLCLKLQKTKLLWLMMLPRSQLGCLVCCGQESPHPAGTGDPTWPSSPCQPPNVAHCFAHLTPGCLLPVLLICTRQVSYQMEHNPKTRVVAMRLVGNNRKFI